MQILTHIHGASNKLSECDISSWAPSPMEAAKEMKFDTNVA